MCTTLVKSNGMARNLRDIIRILLMVTGTYNVIRNLPHPSHHPSATFRGHYASIIIILSVDDC